MASLEQRGNSFRVVFLFDGKKHRVSLGTNDPQDAQELQSRIERRLRNLQHGDAELPPDADFHEWLLTDGKVVQKKAADVPRTLHALFEAYFSSLPPGANEQNTLATMRIHQRHLERILGASLPLANITTNELQRYVNERAKEDGNRGKVTPTTIEKDIITLRTVWNWGRRNGRVTAEFPGRGLKYPKGKEKPPFMTYAEISRATKGIPAEKAAELWEALFLTVAELKELLKHVRSSAGQPFVYPFFAFAAYTGARRSEILRAEIRDVDFEGGVITVRERKRRHDQVTTRRVPIHPELRRILKDWLVIHPGGQFLFMQSEIARSKTERPEPAPITRDEAHDHLKRALADSKWSVVRGYHTLRHSFISNAAAAGVDERMLDQWTGHTTEVRKRYLHLLPSKRHSAILAVFGGK